MEAFLEFLNQPYVVKFAKLLFWIVLIVIGISLLRKLVKRRIDTIAYRYKVQKGIEVIGYFFIVMLIAITLTAESIKDYTIIIGLFTAGLTFTLQELILSIAGSFYIFFVRVYKPGDRIEINNIKGDVIDIDSIYTTIMEIGEWVSSDNYTGRIVKISNAFVFKGPIKNYSIDFPFVWDELNILVTHDSDLPLAQKLVQQEANVFLADYVSSSKNKWKQMVERYYIEDAALDPTLALEVTDNWVNINLRYITDYKKRRYTRHRLFDQIKSAIEKSGESVKLASSTLQLLKIPEVDVKITP
ncbi:MAG: mechanosensitive ion channel family protein [Croceitalea sp.]|nr:mechanosensitive ion channel family protein [Croceitalea sp.]